LAAFPRGSLVYFPTSAIWQALYARNACLRPVDPQALWRLPVNKLIWIAGLVLSAQLAYAADEPKAYQYGDKLDIAKVISLDVPAGGCEVVTARMIYVDSKGETHETTYLRQGPNCHDF
jgi:hypothetical protein